MRELNLTEEQRQQQRTILQKHLGATKAQREELFKLREKRIDGTFTADDESRAQALRQEIRSSREGIRTEMAKLLTDEQRAKLEQLKSERKACREEMRERRRDFDRRDDTPR
jgi:Spy/CpxP family protein refolding chaperone